MKKIFGVYKESGMSSFAVVSKVRRAFNEKKVGHAGTLDLLARGVLVIAVGKDATRSLAREVAKEKEYVAVARFGFTSTTDDEEGEKSVVNVDIKPELEAIKSVVDKFIGEISQVPPIFSAIKVGGKRAYKSARAGQEVKMLARPALVKSIEILDYQYPDLKLKIITGPGVYIRSLARDIGRELGVGGYLADLERTRVGEFTAEEAVKLDKLDGFAKLNG